VHGWVDVRFGGSDAAGATALSLSARCRQFSSFILMVGRIDGPAVSKRVLNIFICLLCTRRSVPVLLLHSHEYHSLFCIILFTQSFDPSHAVILTNKDEIDIPLLLETIPTPKEFKDAIESLSPEQRAFCEAFRGMQVGVTLFFLFFFFFCVSHYLLSRMFPLRTSPEQRTFCEAFRGMQVRF
jgi:hypothetical protein